MIEQRLLRSTGAGMVVPVIIAALTASVSGTASAQEQQQQSQRLEEITVTGSRIQRSGFDTPTPVTVVAREMIDDLGLINVGDVAAQLPSNNPQVTPMNVGVSNFNLGAQLANIRGLNPYFGTRTLTLIDGHRFVPSTNGGAVDLALIPSNLVARMEVVSGGASAAYGSDAVAGVVNVVLDHELEGFRVQLDYGETFRSDGDDEHVGLAGGFKLFEGRGHFVIGGEYNESGLIGDCTATRSWCKPYLIFDVPDAGDTGGLIPVPGGTPDYLLVDNARGTRTLSGNIIATTAPGFGFGGPNPFAADPSYPAVPPQFQGVQFTEAGTALTNWQVGDYLDTGSYIMAGGDGLNPDHGTPIRLPVERYSLYSRFQYDFTDRLEGFAEASYGVRKASNEQRGLWGPIGTFGNGVLIQADNAFLSGVTMPNSVQTVSAALAAAGKNGFYLNKHDDFVITPTNNTENETRRIVLGVEGEFGDTWGFDAYYSYGENDQSQSLSGSRRDPAFSTNNHTGYPTNPFVVPNQFNTSRFDWAVDAVFNPDTPDPNDIACRALTSLFPDPDGPGPLTAGPQPLAAGCVPLNLFGTGSVTQAALDYAYGTLVENFEYTQHVIGGNVQGELVDLWAGALSLATGLEYRSEEGITTHGAPAGTFWPDYGADFRGEMEVIEGYLEFDLPLLRDLPGVRALDVNLAARQTRNKSSSDDPLLLVSSKTFDFTTRKATLVWSPVDWLRVRGTRSRDIRAPGFRELFVPPGAPTPCFNTVNPWTGVVDACNILGGFGGNVDLLPEDADTWTAGFVLTPGGRAERFRLSVDVYEIKLKNGIAGVFSSGVLTGCFNGNTVICQRINEGQGSPPYNDIVTITTGTVNSQAFTTRGIDYEVAYRLPLERMGGNLNFRALVSRIDDLLLEQSDTGGFFGGPPALQGFVGTDYAGQSGSGGAFGESFGESPKWVGNVTLGYDNGPLRTTLQARYIGDAQMYNDLIGPDNPAFNPALTRSINLNTVDDAWFFTLSGSYEFARGGAGSSTELFAVINNVFDKEPPLAPPIPTGGLGGGYAPTNPVFYDMIGRSFRVGARLRF